MLLWNGISWIYLSNEKQLSIVATTPVTKLMGQDGNDLLRITLLDQSIINNNAHLPRKTIEVGIAVGVELATVDDIKLMERKVYLLSQSFDTSLELTRFKRRDSEPQANHNRVDGNSEDESEDGENPQIVEKRVPSFLDNLHHSSDNRSTYHNKESLIHDPFRDPGFKRRPVESEFLLENERLIIRQRQGEDASDNTEREYKQESLADLALEPGWEIPS